MTPGELLDNIREHYLSRFSAELDSRAAAGTRVLTEVAFRDASGAPSSEGPYDLPARSDVVVINDGKATEVLNVDTDTMLSFQPISFDWDSARVTLGPFQWNWCEVHVAGESVAAEPIVAWFRSWFRDDEDGSPGNLLGAVHFMSDPEVDAGNHLSFAVDLGSAPVEALEELLDATRSAGANEVTVGAA
jgi:hypothetical protein